MTRPFAIRLATPADDPALLRLTQELQAAERDLRPTRADGLSAVLHYTRMVQERLADPDEVGVVLVATAADARDVPIGFATLFLEHDPLEVAGDAVLIQDLCVTQAWQRRGVARALLRAAADWAAARGIARLTVAALANNRPALATYRALGFTPLAIELEVMVEAVQRLPA